MTDYRELLEAIYGNLSKLHGLIKDNEQDLRVVDKADSLVEDAKTDLLYLKDCIYSDISRSPHVSTSPPDSGVRHNQQHNNKQPILTDDSDDEIL